MKKYIKPFFLVVLNNVLLYMFLYMMQDYMFWGWILYFTGLCYFLTFFMLVVCVHCEDLAKYNIKI